MAVRPRSLIPVAASLAGYDYLRPLTRSRLAWEYLRRNPAYQADWLESVAETLSVTMLADGTVLLQARRRSARAEAWGLWSFR